MSTATMSRVYSRKVGEEYYHDTRIPVLARMRWEMLTKVAAELRAVEHDLSLLTPPTEQDCDLVHWAQVNLEDARNPLKSLWVMEDESGNLDEPTERLHAGCTDDCTEAECEHLFDVRCDVGRFHHAVCSASVFLGGM